MSGSSRVNQQDSQLSRVLELIRGIAEKSARSDFIYRGEPELYDRVSSTLFRQYADEIESEHFNVEFVQNEILDKAKRYMHGTDIQILTELQHFGGKTNLIDFTTDYNIALFFACDGSYDEDGRVVFKEIVPMREQVMHPQDPENRVIAQKSVFIRPPGGFVEPDDLVVIPNDLKQHMLTYLRKSHGISTETVYNDLHGFINPNNSVRREKARNFSG